MTNNNQSNNYILATENDYNNPTVLCFTSAKERDEYLKHNYTEYSVNTHFYMFNSMEELIESDYFENQTQRNSHKLNDEETSMFVQDLLSVIEETEFDYNIYDLDILKKL